MNNKAMPQAESLMDVINHLQVLFANARAMRDSCYNVRQSLTGGGMPPPDGANETQSEGMPAIRELDELTNALEWALNDSRTILAEIRGAIDGQLNDVGTIPDLPKSSYRTHLG